VLDQGSRSILARRSSGVRRVAAQVGLDRIECADAIGEIGGRLGLMNVEYLAPKMRPAGDLR